MKKRLVKLGISEKELAKKIGCAQSTMNDTLNKPSKQSALVPAIHAAIGWDPPPELQDAPPLPSPDAIEMGHMYDRLPEAIRKQLRDQAKTILELIQRQNDN